MTLQAQAAGNSEEMVQFSGQYLTFQLSREAYGVQILKITEIIGMVDITRVPRCPPYVLGVVNLRGKIVPLIDLRRRFGLDPVPYDEKTCIIVANVKSADQKIVVGMVVDTVLEVVSIPAKKIAHAPEYGVALATHFVIGIGKLPDEQNAILLDIDQVLDAKDLQAVIEG